jgi:hypothetical protein
MSRHCRATEMYMHQRAINLAIRCLSYPFPNPEKTNPQETPDPTLCNGKKQVVSSSSSSNSVSHCVDRFNPPIRPFRQSPRNSANNLPSPSPSSQQTHSLQIQARLSGKTHLALAISPEIHPTPDQIIQRRIRRLIQQHSAQRRQRQPQQPRHHTAV